MALQRISMAGGWSLMLVGLGLAAAADDKPVAEPSVFALREVSVFSAQPSARPYLNRGQQASCTGQPDQQVKAYPKLRSAKPLYGKVKFDYYPGKREGTEYCFVLDESGEAAPTETNGKPADAAGPREPTLLERISAALQGTRQAPPTSPGPQPKRSGYDRLYFDLNRDLDLTNDPPLVAMKDPPWHALPPWTAVEKQAFDCISAEMDFGPGVGKKPFRVLPWLMSSGGSKDVTMFFVAAEARAGRIRIGKRSYDAVLGQPYLITGRFDRPSTGLQLTPVDASEQIEQRGFESEMLFAMRRVDGQLYSLSATPTGDKMLVTPYGGDLGVLELGPGNRDIKEMSFQGSLRSEEAAVGIGESSVRPGVEEKARTATVPVGDYLPSYVSIDYGPLQLSVSDNYHSDGQPRHSERARTYGIKIRKDKPFVLDFSRKPAVLFASPAKGGTVKPGDEVSVAAVLVDPELDVMIRRLNDTRQNQKKSYKLPDGKEQSYEQPLSLDPVVTVTDSTGKEVASGPMPFG